MPHRDPEQRREYERRYREANREKLREYGRQYRAEPENAARESERRRKQKAEQRTDPDYRKRENERERLRLADPAVREKYREHKRKYLAENQEKVRNWRHAYRQANLENVRASSRRSGPRIRHGRDFAEMFAAMWAAQSGRCYLCGDDLIAEQTVVDHDHRCCPASRSCAYCRRGLACGNCNSLIGFARDDPDRLRRIAASLETALAAADERMAGKPLQAALDL